MKWWLSFCFVFLALSQSFAIDEQINALGQADLDEGISQEGSAEHVLVSRNLFLFGLHAEESETCSYADPTNRNSLQEIMPIIHLSLEQSRTALLVQYLGHSTNFPIRLRKADSIFPFHYFW